MVDCVHHNIRLDVGHVGVVEQPLDCSLRKRGGDGRDGSRPDPRHLGKRIMGRTPPRQHRARRRVDRDATARFGPAHQPLVPGMLRARHRSRRPRRLRHRPDRPVRILRRHLPHLARRRPPPLERTARPLPHPGRPDRREHGPDGIGRLLPRTRGAFSGLARRLLPHPLWRPLSRRRPRRRISHPAACLRLDRRHAGRGAGGGHGAPGYAAGPVRTPPHRR